MSMGYQARRRLLADEARRIGAISLHLTAPGESGAGQLGSVRFDTTLGGTFASDDRAIVTITDLEMTPDAAGTVQWFGLWERGGQFHSGGRLREAVELAEGQTVTLERGGVVFRLAVR